MSSKERLCNTCGQFISGTVIQTEAGPAHDCGELLAEVARLRTERDALAEALRTIGSDYCTHERCNSREHRKARAALSRLEDPGQGRG